MFFKRSSKGRQAIPDTRNRSCKGIEAYAHMMHSRGRGERNWTEKGAFGSKSQGGWRDRQSFYAKQKSSGSKDHGKSSIMICGLKGRMKTNGQMDR